MTGKAHAGDRQAEAGARLHKDEGERDRQARPALEHVVQKAVPRIVVVLLVAAEAALAEQVASERDRRPLGYPRGHDPLPRSFGESVELGEVRGGLERRIGDPRDRERRATEVGALAGRDERGEVIPQAAGGAHVHSQSSTTFPSGSRTQSCDPPNSR